MVALAMGVVLWLVLAYLVYSWCKWCQSSVERE